MNLNPYFYAMKLNIFNITFGFVAILLISLIFIQFVSFEWIVSFASKFFNKNALNSLDTNLFQSIKNNGLLAAVLICALLLALYFYRGTCLQYTSRFVPFCKGQFRNIYLIFKNNQSSTNLVLVVLIGAGFIARFMLANEPITYDEAFSVNEYSSTNFLNILTNYNYPNNHVFYNLLTHPLYNMHGGTYWAIRFIALVFGMLCIPSAFVLGMQLFKEERKALFLVSLVALSPIMMEYSALGRGYSLIWFLSIWSIISINSFLKSNDKRALILFILFSGLSIWTIPIAILPTLTILIYLVHKKGLGNAVKLGAITTLLVSVLYLPILLIYGLKITSIINLGEIQTYQRLFEYHLSHGLMDIYFNFIMIKPIIFSFFGLLLLISIIKNSPFNKWLLYLIGAALFTILLQKSIPPSRVWSIILIFIYIPLADTMGSFLVKTRGSLIIFLFPVIVLSQLIVASKKTFMMYDFRYSSVDKIVSGVSEPLNILCKFPLEAPVQYYWKSYLRDDERFNAVGNKNLILVSTKHGQSLEELCDHFQLNRNNYELYAKEEEVEVYTEIEREEDEMINFEF